MSRDPFAERPVPTLQPAAEPGVGGAFAADASLHARLRSQLDALGSGRSANPAATLNALLPVISKQYESMDDERRSVVRSMQLLADEARGFAQGLTGSDAGQLRAILDHIKDVVITATDDGAIQLFNPTGEQLFGYSQAELVGVSIVRLLPELQVQGSLVRGLQAYADQSAADLITLAMDAGAPDNITCIVADLTAQPSRTPCPTTSVSH